MNLSAHFTKEEAEYSITALRRGLDNTMPADLVANAAALCEHILEPLRLDVARPVTLDSLYRSLEVNRAVGSKDDSQHRTAQAADIRIKGMTPVQVCDRVMALGLPFDQLIEEFGPGGWCHVSYSPRNRRMRFKIP